MNNNNNIILEGCIEKFKNTNEIQLNDSEVFEIFSLTQITKTHNLSYEHILNSIVDGGNDGGIDSILILIDNEPIDSIEDIEELQISDNTYCKFIISQCKKEKSFKEVVIDKLFSTLECLFDLNNDLNNLSARFNPNIIEKTLLIREVWRKTVINGGDINIEFNYVCFSNEIVVNGAFTNKVEQLKDIAKRIFNCQNVSYANYSCNELLELFKKQKTKRLSIVFKDQPLFTNYLNYGNGYIGMVKLKDYKNFLTDENSIIRDDLFESNIRHYQGEVDVNKGIKASIENVIDKDFWWLNNGITIIANNPQQYGKELSLENIQIVNGLQTSYSIFNTQNRHVEDERSVLVKVIINSDKETIDNIIASTNNQNPVNATLLRATDKIQRDIEIYFENEGYYYDRRKNFYKNLGKPSSRIFSIQNTAQAIKAIILKDPHTARATPTALLKNDKTYKSIFNSNNSYKLYLNCCLIYKSINDHFSNITDKKIKGILSNFKLHLSWIYPRIILNNNNLSQSDIENFNFERIDNDFNTAVNFILDCITRYQTMNPDANLINMAKSSDFTEYIGIEIDNIINRL
ncbi:MAG: AIPR family protein [Bacteroidales bacterium]|nr:AIPR family protein [Bacteroidales bacterium]